APDDVVFAEARAPDDVVADERGAPDDVVCAPGRAPDDVVGRTVRGDGRPLSPADAVLPRARGRLEDATGEAVAAPINVSAPRRRERRLRSRQAAREEFCESNRAERIEESGALLERTVAAVDFSGVLENRLHEVRRELGIRLKH